MTTPGDGEVRIWIASLDLGAEAVDRPERLLSDDERERAARFCFRRDAICFVARRAVLRTILGECLGVEPCMVDFSYGPRGWTLEALAPDPEYVAAIAIEGRPRRLVTWQEFGP